MVGLGCCFADAHEIVKKIVKYVAQCKGGQGVVREFIDMIRGWEIGNGDEVG